MSKKSVIGWLSPDGIFYKCGYGEHDEKAMNLVSELKIQTIFKDDMFLRGAGLLEELGWFRFVQSSYYDRYDNMPDKGFVFFDLEKMITYEQLKWINEKDKRKTRF